MKQLTIMTILLLSVIFYVQGMEVWGETKNSETSFLINPDKQTTYLSVSYPIINSSTGYDSPRPLIASIKQLPGDIQKYTKTLFLAVYLNEFDDEKKNKLLLNHHPVLLINLIARAERLCPLYLGNKEFGWKDVIVLKKEERENLSKICNQDPCISLCVGTSNQLFCDYGCFRGYKCLDFYGCSYKKTYSGMLKAMPKHIKKGLVVDLTNDSVCAYSMTVISASTLTSSVLCGLCGVSLSNATGFFIAGTVATCTYVAERIKQKWCSKKYYVDRDVVE